MILRRLSQSLKEQNWAAIWIEFILLVFGVFLGIQVANWNEARRDREAEREYLERLRQEIAVILPEARSTKDGLAKEKTQIDELLAFLATGQGGADMDVRHCIAASRSHIYAATIYYPPTIKELISTGRILLVRDPAVRTAIMAYDQKSANMTQLRTDIQIDRRVLARYYPALIDSGRSIDWSGVRCDFAGMRHDPAFMNDFIDNARRYTAYVGTLGDYQAEALATLAQALEPHSSRSPQSEAAHSADGSVVDDKRTKP
jgi:hypothetical protein